MLAQSTPQGEQPIFFLSHKLTPPETKFEIIKKEALVMCCAINKVHYYLWGQAFTVVTDHAPLQWLTHMKDINP